ncbi:MAG: phospholipase D-like domain-containing protein [Planctomycetota bacterium]
MISAVLLALHWALAIALTLRLMFRKKPLGESLAWLFVIYALPLAGAAFYYAFGERRQGDRRVRRLETLSDRVEGFQQALSESPSGLELPEDALAVPLARYVTRTTGFPVVMVKDCTLLETYDKVFAELVERIDAAKHTCHLEFYIWESEGGVAAIEQALLRAAQRGVTVRILVDSIGSDGFISSTTREELEAAGCQFQVSMRMHLFGGRWDLRNLRKLVVIDDDWGLSGSMNLVDPELFKSDAGVGHWIDAMVRVDGAGAQSLNAVFLQDWCVELSSSEDHADLWQVPELPAPTENRVALQVLPSGPGIYSEAIHQVLMMAIYAADEEILISTPYFVPGEAILQALIAAAMRGVKVTIIVPETSDFRIACYAGASNYTALMEAGATIARFQRTCCTPKASRSTAA